MVRRQVLGFMLVRWVKHGGLCYCKKYASSMIQDVVFFESESGLYQLYFFAGI